MTACNAVGSKEESSSSWLSGTFPPLLFFFQQTNTLCLPLCPPLTIIIFLFPLSLSCLLSALFLCPLCSYPSYVVFLPHFSGSWGNISSSSANYYKPASSSSALSLQGHQGRVITRKLGIADRQLSTHNKQGIRSVHEYLHFK